MRRSTALVVALTLLAAAPAVLAQEGAGWVRLPPPPPEIFPSIAPAGFEIAGAGGSPGYSGPAPLVVPPVMTDASPAPLPQANVLPFAVDTAGFGRPDVTDVESPTKVSAAPDGTGYLPRTYVRLDALYWHRVGTGCDQVLAIDTDRTPGLDTVLRTSDLHFNGQGGWRILVGWRPDPCWCPHCSAWELSYFGIYNFHAEGRVTGNGDLAIPGDLGLASNNFFLTDIIEADYRSQLQNVELNCIHTCCLPCATLDFLAGFRYINLTEDFTITGTDFQEGTSDYAVQTDNNLYGLQLGGRYTRHWTCWSAQLVGKAAVFINDAHQSQVARDFPIVGNQFVLRPLVSDDGAAVAALGELQLNLIRRLTDTWALRMGYNVIGLGGLALAPDQLDFTDTFRSGSDLDTNGWIFVHGGFVGLEANW